MSFEAEKGKLDMSFEAEKGKLEYTESPVSTKSLLNDDFEDIDKKKLTRKIDLRLLPIFTVLFLLSFLDRGNIGNAKIEGLAEDLNLEGNQYNLCLTIFFIFYATAEIPSNMILKRWKPNVFVPLTVTLFAIVMTLMGTVQNYAQLMATRALLGLFEAALFPGISYMLSMYYRKNELLFRQAIFVSAASMAGAFSGLLAAAISNMDGVGGYEGWRWIFIIEGLITFVFGLLSFWWFPRYPKDAAFLTQREREFVLWNVHHSTNQDKVHPDAPKGEDQSSDRAFIWAVFKDLNCWCQLFSYLGIALPTYGISLFMPTIVKNLGYTSVKAQLMTVPIYAVGAFWSVVQGYISDRSGYRSPFLALNYLCMIIGFICCISLDPRVNPNGIYAAIYIICFGMYPAIPLSIVWNANNLSGSYKRAIGIGFQIGLANYGGAFVSNFYREQDSPRFILGHALTLGFVSLAALAMVIVVINYIRTNRKDQAAIEAGDYAGYTDEELRKMGDKSPYFTYRL
ncbi:hypothetical protein FT663_00104 [Candidozyma haemuli var. vulneris]|nr:hypothetical protein FT662_00270 [[Candida] haemuloni var. vulneris]KAF3995881.1 hypothetical protein FT663_00104 [[Candida] haemuloni var. vulneris]